MDARMFSSFQAYGMYENERKMQRLSFTWSLTALALHLLDQPEAENPADSGLISLQAAAFVHEERQRAIEEGRAEAASSSLCPHSESF